MTTPGDVMPIAVPSCGPIFWNVVMEPPSAGTGDVLHNRVGLARDVLPDMAREDPGVAVEGPARG